MKARVRVLLGVVVLAMSSLFVVGCTTISPGHVGIVVNSLGGNKGVQGYTAQTGLVTYNPITTTVFEYPTFVQTVSWTHDVKEGHPQNEEITFTNKDNMNFSVDVSLSYSLQPEKVPAFYVKFRSDDLSNFTHGMLRNETRDAFNEVGGKYSIDQIMGDNGGFFAEVRQRLQQSVSGYGVQIEQFGPIGSPRPPDAVIQNINQKVQATQRAIQSENEVRQVEAEAKKKVAQARGEAESNELLTKSINPSLLEWKRLEINFHALQKWDGKLPTFNGGGGMPFVTIPTQK